MNRKNIRMIFVIAGIVSAILYFIGKERFPNYLVDVLKLIPTFLIIVWIIFGKPNKADIFLLIGFIFAFLCDMFMSWKNTYAGIATNIIALIFYTIFFFIIQNRINLFRLLYPTVFLGLFYFLIFKKLGPLQIPVFVYCIVYSIFNWRSLSFIGNEHLSAKIIVYSIAGSILITISDCILALQLFGIIESSIIISIVIMSFWWIGIFLLLLVSENRKGRINN